MNVNNKNLHQLLNQVKASAKRRGIPVDLTVADLGEMSFPITCPILNIPLKFNTGRPQDNSYSLDRIDSTKGYTVDNIVVVSYRANKIKSNATLEELKGIVEFYDEINSASMA